MEPAGDIRVQQPRGRTFLHGQICFNDGRSTLDCIVRDISEQGARLEIHQIQSLPDSFRLILPQKKQEYLATIKWRRAEEVGVEFANQESSAADESLRGLLERVKKLETEVALLRRISVERKILGDL